jgi:hypothetical protein
MKRLSLVMALLGAFLVLQIPMCAAPQTPIVTRDNFVSLRYESSGGYANLKSGIALQGNLLLLEEFPGSGGTGLASGKERVPFRPTTWLSNNQLDEIIRSINQARLPAMAGKYHQANLADGVSETLVLVISDDRNEDQSFVIENYGNTAPPEFYRLAEGMRQMRLAKFPDEHGTTTNQGGLVTRENLRSLSFKSVTVDDNFGGLSLDFVVAKDAQDDRSWLMSWTSVRNRMGHNTSTKGIVRVALTELIPLVNAVNWSDLNGRRFRDKGLMHGADEVATLTLEDGRQFTVSNYGNSAPAEYYKITEYLRALQQQQNMTP